MLTPGQGASRLLRFAPALRVTRCSRRLNGIHGRKRASGQHLLAESVKLGCSPAAWRPRHPLRGPETTNAELPLLLGRSDNTHTKSESVAL